MLIIPYNPNGVLNNLLQKWAKIPEFCHIFRNSGTNLKIRPDQEKGRIGNDLFIVLLGVPVHDQRVFSKLIADTAFVYGPQAP